MAHKFPVAPPADAGFQDNQRALDSCLRGKDVFRSIPRRFAPHGGFTYVGVMILIAILALGSAATLSVGSALQQRMNEAELLFIGGQFADAFKSYFEATPVGQRNYPAKLEELLRDPRYPGVRRHLRKIYVDPMTGNAEWGLVAAPGGVVGVHSLSQRTPIKVAEFDPAYAALTGKTGYADWKFGFAPPGLVLPGNPQLAGTIAPVVKPAAQKPPVPQTGTAGAVSPAPVQLFPSPAPQSPAVPAEQPPTQ